MNRLQIRALDPQVAVEFRVPLQVLSLPRHSIAKLDAHQVKVLIVKNKTTLASLKQLDGFIALGGLGFGVNVLSEIPWLECVPVFYWRDIDVQGYQILANLRRFLSQVQSVLMDCKTL